MAYDLDSGAVMAASVFMTIRILRPKWPGPKVVTLSSVYCSIRIISIFGNTELNIILMCNLYSI